MSASRVERNPFRVAEGSVSLPRVAAAAARVTDPTLGYGTEHLRRTEYSPLAGGMGWTSPWAVASGLRSVHGLSKPAPRRLGLSARGSQSPSNKGVSAHPEPFDVAQDMLVEGHFQRKSTDSAQPEVRVLNPHGADKARKRRAFPLKIMSRAALSPPVTMSSFATVGASG